MSVCINLCLYITLPLNSTLGGGNIKAYFIIVQPKLAHHLGLLGILGFTILLTLGVLTGNTSLVYIECGNPSSITGDGFLYFRLAYLWVNKSYLLVSKGKQM